MEYIEKIDAMGGMPIAIEKAYIQQEIQNNAYLEQKKIEEGQRTVIGVNTFCTDEECKIETFKHDKEFEKKIVVSLDELRKTRNEGLVQEKLAELKNVAQSTKNIIPIMIETVKTYATIQEICDALREVFGEYQSPQIF